MLKIIPVLGVVVICWAVWAVKTLSDCKKNNIPFSVRFKELWTDRFWIGPERFMNIREILVIAIFAIRFGCEIIDSFAEPPFSLPSWFNIASLIIYPFLLGRYSIKQYAIVGAIWLVVCVDVFFIEKNTADNALIKYSSILFYILMVYDIGLQKIMKMFFAVLSAIYGLSVILSLSGVISSGNKSVMETRLTDDGWLSTRYAFGFKHPNTAGILLAMLIVLWLAVRFSKLRWWDWVIGVAVLGIITFVIDSRAAMMFLVAFLVLVFIAKYFPKFYDFGCMKYIFAAVPAVCASASVIGAYFYNPDSVVWQKINSLTTGRVSLIHSAAEKVPVTLFGKSGYSATDFLIDNFYVKFLLFDGIIPFIILIALYTFLVYRLCKLRAYPEVALTVSYMAYYCFESLFFKISMNCTFYLFLIAFMIGDRMFISLEEKKKRLTT